MSELFDNPDKPTCELIGHDGNALSIVARASRALRKAGQGDLVNRYREEALSGDYNNVLQVTMRYVEVE